MQDQFADIARNPGFHVVTISSPESDGGTSYGVVCKGLSGSWPTNDELNYACAALAMAPALGLGLLLTLTRCLGLLRRPPASNRPCRVAPFSRPVPADRL